MAAAMARNGWSAERFSPVVRDPVVYSRTMQVKHFVIMTLDLKHNDTVISGRRGRLIAYIGL